MQHAKDDSSFGPAVHVVDAPAAAAVLLVCEHASNRVPEALGALGLSERDLQRHIAWDPGALVVAQGLAERLVAPLMHGGISRLVYDCNRPPEAPDAIPPKSEIFDIPGNADLTDSARQERIDQVYVPFRDRLSAEIAARPALRLMVTVHSFTPIYRGEQRDVQLGILHGDDDRFAHAMLAAKPSTLPFVTRINDPYGPADGVAHTLNAQGCANGLLNVMLEIRNDLIATPADQAAWADWLAPWLTQTLAALSEGEAA